MERPALRQDLCTGVLLGILLLAGSSPLAALQQTREEDWRQERHEKAEVLAPPERGPLEKVMFEIEESIDDGWLGEILLGLPVYAWLLILLTLVTFVRFLSWLRRRLLRRTRKTAGS